MKKQYERKYEHGNGDFFPFKNKANVNIRNEKFSEPNKSTMESFTHKLNQEEKEDTKDKGHGQWNSTQASNRK